MYPPFGPVSLIQQYYTTEPRLRPTGISLSPFLNHVILALVQKDSYLSAVIVQRFMFIAVFILYSCVNMDRVRAVPVLMTNKNNRQECD